jgi:glycosyltransferase involved in cell wall biosynthesis
VIYDGLDTEGFRPVRDAATVRKALGISRTDPLVGIVGNIQHWKGQAVVVEAIREVRAVVPEIRCLLVGGVHRNGAAYARDLKRSITEHKLQNQVICTGVREDVADLMAAMDIVIHASVAPEPFGRVILEGMALGKAVIATNIGGVPEFVQDDVTGRLVPPSDPQALARTILELLGDVAQREQLGHQGCQEVRRRFDIQHHVEAITHAYASLRGGRPSEPTAPEGGQESARRLVLVISKFSSGGAQRVLSILANAWAAKGWHITLLTLDNGEEPPFYDLHPAVRYRPLGLSGTSSTSVQGVCNNLKRLRILRQAIVQSTPQAVISFIDKPNVLTILATLGLPVPVIVSERIDPAHHPIGKGWEWLRRWTYPRCSCLVIQCRSALSYFSATVQRRARVIPNPVVLPDGAELVPKSANGTSAKTVIAIGRLSDQKGFDLLLEAFAQVAPQHPEWSLVIWGEGAQRPHLERLRDDLGLQGRVSFPGLTRQPFEAMRQADLFVLSSRYEGFPNVLCEAMACALPVISFDCPSGPGEIVTDDIDGVLVPPGDVAALATAMARLMASEPTRKRLAAQARRVTDRFDLAHVLEMWEKVVAEVTGATAEPVRSSYA